MTEIAAIAFLGGLWRFWDGRGYGPGWIRLIASVGLALWVLWPIGWHMAVPLAALWGVIWLPRQKNREEFDDMLLRWAAPIAAYGVLLAVLLWPDAGALDAALLAVSGLVVAVLVWAGVHVPTPPSWPSWLDSAAISEALAGAVAFGALAAVV